MFIKVTIYVGNVIVCFCHGCDIQKAVNISVAWWVGRRQVTSIQLAMCGSFPFATSV